jgi:hypothetical protein
MNQDIIAQSAIKTKLEMYENNSVYFRFLLIHYDIKRKENELRDLRETFKRLKKELKPLKVVA